METNRLYFGDCLKILKTFHDKSIDLIISDPPFGVNLKNDDFIDNKDYISKQLNSWIKELFRVLKINGHCYLYAPILEIDFWIYTVKQYFIFKNLIIAPNYGANNYLSNNFSFDYQPIIFCSKEDAKDFNKVDWIETSIAWQKDKRNKNSKPYTYKYPALLPKKYRANVKSNAQFKKLHVCQKNVELIEKLIMISSKEGDVVLDSFCGSGSTVVSAKKLNRKYIGIDNDQESIKITELRLEA